MSIKEYLQRLFAHMGVEIEEISIQEKEEQITVQIDIEESEVGIVIGYRGETLTAIQRILRIVFHQEFSQRIVVNINDYRQKRESKVLEMLQNAVLRVRETGEEYQFGYISANERFIIHSEIAKNQEYQDLTSYSQGEGRDRFLIISLKKTEEKND